MATTATDGRVLVATSTAGANGPTFIVTHSRIRTGLRGFGIYVDFDIKCVVRNRR